MHYKLFQYNNKEINTLKEKLEEVINKMVNTKRKWTKG